MNKSENTKPLWAWDPGLTRPQVGLRRPGTRCLALDVAQVGALDDCARLFARAVAVVWLLLRLLLRLRLRVRPLSSAGPPPPLSTAGIRSAGLISAPGRLLWCGTSPGGGGVNHCIK